MLSLCCGIHENRGKRGGEGRDLKNMSFVKNNYCEGEGPDVKNKEFLD